MKQKFLDPLYGPVEVDDEARELIFSADFQRLRYVRLCNINSLFVTGASEPKRFEHCIGVYHLAAVWTQLRGLAPRDARVLRAAALVHDLKTGPFGHSFQYVLEDNPFEQQFEHANLSGGIQRSLLQNVRMAASFGGRPFSAEALLGDIAADTHAAVRGEGPFGPLIAGTLDLDNLDNVVRLAFHVGLCDDADRRLPMRLLELLHIQDGRLAVDAGGGELLLQWFNLRRRLYEYLLLDRGEFAAKAMLTLAVEKAADADIIGPDSWRLTDEELLAEMESGSVGDQQVIGQTVKRLRLGDLFDCIEVWSSPSTKIYEAVSEARNKRAIEREIEAKAAQEGGARLRVCLHPILDKKKTCRSLTFLDLTSGEDGHVGWDSNQLLVGVFVMNARSDGIGEQVRQRYERVARQVLEKYGLQSPTPAPEPLNTPVEMQRELLLA